MHIHNETGCAKTALSSVVNSHTVLDRINAVTDIPNAFNSGYFRIGNSN
jgi:hypothetical protein